MEYMLDSFNFQYYYYIFIAARKIMYSCYNVVCTLNFNSERLLPRNF